jgi:hypothetical protein
MRQNNLRLGSQLGQSLTELLIASAIIAISAGGLGVTIKKSGDAQAKADIVTTQYALASALVNQMTDPASYSDPAVKSALDAGNIPAGLNLPVNMGSMGTMNWGVSNVETFLTRDLQSCTGFSQDCVFRVRLDLSWDSGATIYKYAYQIMVNPDVIPVPSVGSNSNVGFAPSDYQVVIPRQYYTAEAITSCDPATELFAYGYNRTNGTLLCMQKPTPGSGCSANQIPIGIEFVGTTLQMKCADLRTSFECPANYSLQSFDPRTFDTRTAGKVGTCVYVGQTTEVLTPKVGKDLDNGSIDGEFCPPDYRVAASSSCTLDSVTAIPGPMGACFMNTEIVDSTSFACPNPPSNVQTTYFWAPGPPQPAPSSPNAGSATFSIPPGDPRRASCTVSAPAQSCGASWKARARLVPTCELAVPEVVSVL